MPHPTFHGAPFDQTLELLRQGNKFARHEQFSEAESVFRAAASLPNGKAIWNEKPLGLNGTVFFIPFRTPIDMACWMCEKHVVFQDWHPLCVLRAKI